MRESISGEGVAPPARWEKVKKGGGHKGKERHDDDVDLESEDELKEAKGKLGKVSFGEEIVTKDEETTKLMSYSDGKGRKWEEEETEVDHIERVEARMTPARPTFTPSTSGTGISSRLKSLFHPTQRHDYRSAAPPMQYGEMSRIDLDRDIEALRGGRDGGEDISFDKDATLRPTRPVFRTSVTPPSGNVCTASPLQASPSTPAAPLVVPATPSLLNALQRINEAQRQAQRAPVQQSAAAVGGDPKKTVVASKCKEREFTPRALADGERDGGRKGWEEWWKNIADKQ